MGGIHRNAVRIDRCTTSDEADGAFVVGMVDGAGDAAVYDASEVFGPAEVFSMVAPERFHTAQSVAKHSLAQTA